MVLGGPDFRLPRRRILESSHFWPEAMAEVDLLVNLEQKSRAKKTKKKEKETEKEWLKPFWLKFRLKSYPGGSSRIDPH